MEEKESLFLYVGLILCVVGIFILIFGYEIHKKEAFTFDALTLIIFSKVIANFNLDYYFFPYSYPIFDLFYILNRCLELIQETLQPLIISVVFPITGFICVCIGGILIVLTIIFSGRRYISES